MEMRDIKCGGNSTYFHHISHEFCEGTQKRVRVKLEIVSKEMVPLVDGVQNCLQSDLHNN
jgi:hypothetical protein